MRVNLNKIAEQIVPGYRYEQFVDNVMDLDLPPLYRGPIKTFYPTTIQESKIRGRDIMRRYIFKYNSNGSFEFIAVRNGQRNGGNDVSIENSQINVRLMDVDNNGATLKDRNFSIVNNNLFRAGDDVRIVKVNQRYLWQEKPQGSFVFSTLYYSDATTKPLQDADKLGEVNWFQQTTNRYIVAKNSRVVYYNNNTLAGLNSWPIKNVNAKVPAYVNKDWEVVTGFDQATSPNYEALNTLENETKPVMLDDAYLTKCFTDINLDAYDIVFVEVFWKEYTNKTIMKADAGAWLGESFTVPIKKGRVYRVGKLAKSNGVGEYDVITFARRTKIKTTSKKRGGNNIYN